MLLHLFSLCYNSSKLHIGKVYQSKRILDPHFPHVLLKKKEGRTGGCEWEKMERKKENVFELVFPNDKGVKFGAGVIFFKEIIWDKGERKGREIYIIFIFLFIFRISVTQCRGAMY